ncbi:MAG: hypothetical protein ABIF28_09280 [Pseudomonadota bacterium]
MKKIPAPPLTAERATELAQLSELRFAHFQELTGVQPGEIGPYVASADGVVPIGGVGLSLYFPCDPRRFMAFVRGPLSQLVALPAEYEAAMKARAEYNAAWEASIIKDKLEDALRKVDNVRDVDRVQDMPQQPENASPVGVSARKDNLFLAVKAAFENGLPIDASAQDLMDYLLKSDTTGHVVGRSGANELKWRDTKGHDHVINKDTFANRLSRYRQGNRRSG